MLDHRFESVAIPVWASDGREVQVGVARDGCPALELTISDGARAGQAGASVSLTRDGARALIHALEAAIGGAVEIRAQRLGPARGRAPGDARPGPA